MKKVFLLYLCVILLLVITTVFIFHNSLEDDRQSSKASDALTDTIQSVVTLARLADHTTLVDIIRTCAHFLEFLFLGAEYMILMILIEKMVFSKLLFMPLFMVLATALTDEYIQNFVEGRASQTADVLVDFTGGAAGIALTAVIYLVAAVIRRKIRNKKISGTN